MTQYRIHYSPKACEQFFRNQFIINLSDTEAVQLAIDPRTKKVQMKRPLPAQATSLQIAL